MVVIYYGFPITETNLNIGDIVKFDYHDIGEFFRGNPRKVIGKVVGLNLRKNFSEKIKLEGRFFGFCTSKIRILEKL